MANLQFNRAIVVLALGLLGWALCGTVMFVGMAVTSVETTLIAHAVGAPLIFVLISWFYFSRLHYTDPLATAIAFLAIVVFMDVFFVAMVINRSFEMFANPLGTWIPFALIFLATYITGTRIRAGRRPDVVD
ncbi:MAG: hypothetical protein P8X48_04015 [Acidiferrobacteraceae bacterium]|jgi:hypothetical protein